MDGLKIPKHVGIIMDGNGRWAEARGKKRSYGHNHGSANVERVVEHAFKRGVKALTLYAFSSENWARPKEEVDELMRLLKNYFKKFITKLIKNNIRLVVIGGRKELTPDLISIIEEAEERSLGLYDVGAGMLLVTEAGGVILDYDGGNNIPQKGIIAANPVLAKRILPLLKTEN